MVALLPVTPESADRASARYRTTGAGIVVEGVADFRSDRFEARGTLPDGTMHEFYVEGTFVFERGVDGAFPRDWLKQNRFPPAYPPFAPDVATLGTRRSSGDRPSYAQDFDTLTRLTDAMVTGASYVETSDLEGRRCEHFQVSLDSTRENSALTPTQADELATIFHRAA